MITEMKLSFIKPRRELQPYVESIWIFESPIGLPTTDTSIVPPNGCPKLLFLYENRLVSFTNGKTQNSPPQKLYFVGNKENTVSVRSSSRRTGFIGVEFSPHVGFSVFGIPMSETFDCLWEADALFDKWGRETQEILNNLEKVESKVAFIQEQLIFLVQKNARDNRLVEFCVKTLKSTDGRISIQELERKLGYSRRYLDLLFKQHVGLAPKVLAGIFRFQRFYRQWAQGLSFDLFKQDLYDFYYDQAHFTKEFKKMTGHSPRKFSLKISNEFGRRLLLR